MKPYIFNYSDSIRISRPQSAVCQGEGHVEHGASILDSTVLTATVEPGDPDSISASTVVTRSVEPSDADELLAASTYVTESTEPADPDMIRLDSTFFTKSLEPVDEDSVHPLFGFPGH